MTSRYRDTYHVVAKSLLLQRPHHLTWVHDSLPDLGPDDLLLRTRAGAISIGTELPRYSGQARQLQPATYPAMTGYETVADVVAVGPAVQTVAVGDRVVACYGHRTAAVVPESRVVRVPPDITDMVAVLLILACDTARGVSKVPLHAASRVAITGSGTIGLLTLCNLHARGFRDIAVIDPIPHRRTVAQRFGAKAVFDPADAPAHAPLCDVGFECSSRDAAFRLLQELMQPGGHLCILADGNLEPLTLTPAFHAKELMVVGSSDGLDYRDYAAWFWEIVRSERYPFTSLFEQIVDAQALPEVFAHLAGRDLRPLKVFVRYADASNNHEDTEDTQR